MRLTFLLFLVGFLGSDSIYAFLTVQVRQTPKRTTQPPISSRCHKTFSKSSSTQNGSTQLHAFNTLVSDNIIEDLAVYLIKLCLASQTDVSCDLVASPQDMLQGRIGPVKVKGRDWRSSRGLSCRAIEASVDTCQLDFNAVLSRQKLILTSPAKGKCMIAMTAEDFGNFLTHPRLEKAKLTISRQAGLMKALESDTNDLAKTTTQISASPSLIDFHQENIVISPEKGSVTFYANCAGTECKCVLKRAESANVQQTATVEVTTLKSNGANKPGGDEMTASRLATVFTSFFNDMVFELYDGLLLSYRDMKVTGKGTPSILLSLNICVEQFPSPTVRPSDF